MKTLVIADSLIKNSFVAGCWELLLYGVGAGVVVVLVVSGGDDSGGRRRNRRQIVVLIDKCVSEIAIKEVPLPLFSVIVVPFCAITGEDIVRRFNSDEF